MHIAAEPVTLFDALFSTSVIIFGVVVMIAILIRNDRRRRR